MELPTLDGVLKKVGIPQTLLDQKCSDEHISSISLFLDWRRVAPHLGLKKPDIDEIESKKTDSEKRLETLQQWKMKYGYLATYEALVQVLLKVGNADHAERVCQLLQTQVHTTLHFTEPAATGIRKRTATSEPSAVKRSKQDETSGSGAVVASAIPTVQPRASLVATTENSRQIPSTATHSGQPQGSPVTTETFKEKVSIEKEIQDLEDQFFTVVCKAASDLEKVDLSIVKLCIANLPVSLKHQHIKYLEEHLPAIESAESVSEIFSILSQYWDFLNCGLLEEIVRKFGGSETRRLMHEYLEKLKEFRKKTTLIDFIDKWAGSCPPQFSEFDTELDQEEWNARTLEDLERLRIQQANGVFVVKHTLRCIKVKRGCVSVTWGLPNSVPGIADNLQYILPLLKEEYGILTVVFQGQRIPELSRPKALLKACAEGRLEVVTALLSQETDVNTRDPKDGLTPLLAATQNNHTEIVQKLLNAGAEVNVREESTGRTVLFFAAKEGYIEIIQLLLQKGADLRYVDKNNVTALDVAQAHGQERSCQILQEGKDFSPAKHQTKKTSTGDTNKPSPSDLSQQSKTAQQVIAGRATDPSYRGVVGRTVSWHFLTYLNASYILALLCIVQFLLTVSPQYNIVLISQVPVLEYLSIKLNDIVEVAIWIFITILCAASIQRQHGVLGLTSLPNIFQYLKVLSWLFIVYDIIFSPLLVAVYIQGQIYMEWTSGINPLVQTFQMFQVLVMIRYTVYQGIYLLRAYVNLPSLRTNSNDLMNEYLMQLDSNVILNLLLLFRAFIPALEDTEKGFAYRFALSTIFYHFFAVCAFLHLRYKVRA